MDKSPHIQPEDQHLFDVFEDNIIRKWIEDIALDGFGPQVAYINASLAEGGKGQAELIDDNLIKLPGGTYAELHYEFRAISRGDGEIREWEASEELEEDA